MAKEVDAIGGTGTRKYDPPGSREQLLAPTHPSGTTANGPDMIAALADELSRNLHIAPPSLASLAGSLAVACQIDVTVLITGGKSEDRSVIAHMVHSRSSRRSEPFLLIRCGSNPPELFTNSLVGHGPGSCSSAKRPRRGKFECAGKGTIFLDEIDPLGFEQQAALLRLIETGEYEIVNTNERLNCHARMIVASNTDLTFAVERGHFRQDLFYRLNLLPVHLSPQCKRLDNVLRFETRNAGAAPHPFVRRPSGVGFDQ